MEKKGSMNGGGLLCCDGGQYGVGMLGAFSLALKLQALKDENLHLEEHLAAMVLNNRVLQSMLQKNPVSNI